jgi:translation elongation factor IF5A
LDFSLLRRTNLSINQLICLSHVVIKGRPCKIVEIEFSEDEDGDTEIRLVAIDIFTGKKMEDHAPPSYKIDVPTITRTEYQFLYIDEDDYLHLLGNNETEKSDVFVPDNEVGKKIREHEKTGHDFSENFYLSPIEPSTDCSQWSPSSRLWGKSTPSPSDHQGNVLDDGHDIHLSLEDTDSPNEWVSAAFCNRWAPNDRVDACLQTLCSP